MKLGVWFDFRNPAQWAVPYRTLYAQLLEQAVWAESLGFATAWVSEHHVTEDGYMPSPFTVLAAIGSRTSRIGLGTAVTLAPLHHPVQLAEDLAVLDLLVEGRLTVGLAAGYRRKEFDVLGVPRHERGQRTEETVRILRLAWSSTPFSFHGKCFRFDDVVVTPPPAQEPTPRIFLGGTSLAAARRAGRLGCGFLQDAGSSPAVVQAYRQSFASSDQRIPEPAVVANRILFACLDPERAWHVVGPHLLYQHNLYATWALEGGDLSVRGRALTSANQLPRESYFIGTPKDILTALRDVATQGIEEVMFWARLPGASIEDSNSSLELIARDVMPFL